MITLKDALSQGRISYRQLAHSTGISAAVVYHLVNFGEYPVRIGEEETKRRIAIVLAKANVNVSAVRWPEPGVRPSYTGVRRSRRLGLIPTNPQPTTDATEAIELMQLDRSVLQLFGLRTNPFLNDVESDDDVFNYRGHQQVATAITDAIEQRGFLAVVAPSGAGKTTIWDGIESEYGMRDDTVICRPQLKDREKLTPEHIARALIYGLCGEGAHIWREGERRGRQLSQALRAIRTGAVDKKAVLLIDDAHFCSTSMLRQLKTFFEEKIGRFRLLSIIMIGLLELKNKLAAFPEIGNRIRLVEVPPVPVVDYLQFKLRRVGSTVEKLFDPSGWDAFVNRFREPRKAALGYPLLINAACIQAMVKLAQNGAQPGERITREIVDILPGAAVRRVA